MWLDATLKRVGSPVNVLTQQFADPLPVRDCRSREFTSEKWRIVKSLYCNYDDSSYLCTAHKVTATNSETQKGTVYWRQVLGTETISNLLAGSTFHTYRLLLRSKIHSRLHLLTSQNKQRYATEMTSNAEFYFQVTHVRWTLLRQYSNGDSICSHLA
jgi:hypothetical protein